MNAVFRLLLLSLLLIAPAWAVPSKERSPGMEQKSPPSDMKAQVSGEETQLVRDATETYRRLLQRGAIDRNTAENASCIGVFPRIDKAALVVGGSHGQGVASCRGPEGKWSKVAFLGITSVSLGAQLGAEQSDLVLLFMGPQAEERLASGKYDLGAEASYAWGKMGDTAATYTGKDIVAYSNRGGAFVGASLDGTRISTRDEDLRAFYGQQIKTATAFRTYGAPNEPMASRQFTEALSQTPTGKYTG